MTGAVPGLGVMGFKAYAGGRGRTRFLGHLYSAESGELLAVMEADRLGQLRTGAASAVATKHMAPPAAGSIGLLGSGWQARGQGVAASRVRPVALVTCYSRSNQRRDAFAAEMVQELGAEVVAVESPQQAVAGRGIIITATNARDPVLRGEWLAPGMHINAVGSNAAPRRGLDAGAGGGGALPAGGD